MMAPFQDELYQEVQMFSSQVQHSRGLSAPKHLGHLELVLLDLASPPLGLKSVPVTKDNDLEDEKWQNLKF